MRTLVVATVVALAGWSCGAQPAGTATPVSPTAAVTPQPVNYAGGWELTVLQLTCDSPWSRYVCGRPPIQPTQWTLRLAQVGTHVTGVLGTMDVTGDIDDAGRLSLTGSGIVAEYGGTSTLTEFDVHLTDSGGLEGRMAHEWTIPPQFEPLGGTHRKTLTILSAVRGALPSTYAGTWLGHFQLAGCTAARCAGPAKEFQLTLTDDRGALSGTMVLRLNQRVRIGGRATGTTADLFSVNDPTTVADIRAADLHLQRSATGRLSGTLRAEYRWGAMEDLELVDVVLAGVP